MSADGIFFFYVFHSVEITDSFEEETHTKWNAVLNADNQKIRYANRKRGKKVFKPNLLEQEWFCTKHD